ncbi:MAG: shikimate kinase [Bacillota bacterium]
MYGLLGKSLKHSLSKAIHERLNPSITYNLYETDDLKAFFRARPFVAINVTNPYKEACMPYLDKLDESAQKIGAVNTIVDKDGVLVGYNTDYDALRAIIASRFPNDKKSLIAIIGNGATQKTLVTALKDEGYRHLRTFARNPETDQYALKDIDHHSDLDVLINATPVGMYPNNEQSFDFSLEAFDALKLVFDLIYNPLKTNLLLEAEQMNIEYINGLSMLLKQAMKAQEFFFDRPLNIDYSSFLKTLEKDLYNIVFIGLPFSGKSHYGRLFASSMDKPFIDIDQSIERQERSKIATIFKAKGEAYFRQLEAHKVLDIARRHSQVIAPGGGIILSEKAMRALKQNSLIIFLDLDLTLLEESTLENRPLVQDMSDLIALKKNRQSLYERCATLTIRKDTWDETVIKNRIEDAINEYLDY